MFHWLDVLARPVEVLVGSLYPAYKSACSLLEDHYSETRNVWLTYWCIYAAINVLEVFLSFLVARIPLFHVAKLLFVIWLQAPQSQGCIQLYRRFVLPLLKHHQATIDRYLEEGRQRLGERVHYTMQQAGWGDYVPSAFLAAPAARLPLPGEAGGAGLGGAPGAGPGAGTLTSSPARSSSSHVARND